VRARSERLKVSRPSVATEAEEGQDAALLLGVAGQSFRFDTDAPCRVSWCSCVAAAGGGGGGGAADASASVDGVEAFITETISGGHR
jgi:hypothetical protein